MNAPKIEENVFLLPDEDKYIYLYYHPRACVTAGRPGPAGGFGRSGPLTGTLSIIPPPGREGGSTAATGARICTRMPAPAPSSPEVALNGERKKGRESARARERASERERA
jgi:hypothetical protein